MYRLIWDNLEGKRGLFHAAVTRLPYNVGSRAHGHDFHEVFLVTEGSGTHILGKERFDLQAGRLVLVGPEDFHGFQTSGKQTLAFVNLAVSADWWNSFHQVVDVPPGWERVGNPRGHFWPNANAFHVLRTLLFRLTEPGADFNATLLLAWTNVLAAAMNPGPETERIPEWLENLRREMLKPELLSKDTSYWQKRGGRSPEHLARCCRKHYGMSLTELLNQARIERVKYLLQTSDMKVTTAAYETGYNNLAHFYRMFYRLTGQTPNAWRKQVACSTVPI